MSSSRPLLLRKYKENVEKLRKRAKAQNLTDVEINAIFENSFEILKNEKKNSYDKKSCRILRLTIKIIFTCLFLILILYILLNVHQPTSSIVLRNVQGLIHPGLKLVRFLSMPILKIYPSLTYLYDEACLVENPFFYVSDMECWPCQNVHSVLNLTGFKNLSLYQSGIPYIVQINQKGITFANLTKLYKDNKKVFDRDAKYVKSTNTSIKTVNDLFNYAPNKSSNTHIAWRINRLSPARSIRSLFPKPFIVPERAAQSMERYVMIDESNSPIYTLPNLECSYVFVIQGSGVRSIILRPSRECGNSCKTVSVLLQPSYALSYNWWYWRPISLPVENSSQVSISYINCHY